MKRKKFIKNLMSVGIGRNAANWLARERSDKAAYLVNRISRTPGFHALTGVAQSKYGLVFRVKRVFDEP